MKKLILATLALFVLTTPAWAEYPCAPGYYYSGGYCYPSPPPVPVYPVYPSYPPPFWGPSLNFGFVLGGHDHRDHGDYRRRDDHHEGHGHR